MEPLHPDVWAAEDLRMDGMGFFRNLRRQVDSASSPPFSSW